MPPAPRSRVALFAALLPLLLAAQPVATDSYLPALPAIARELGSASTSLTAFVLAFGAAQLGFGPLADRWGRRPVLLLGLALYTVAALACAWAPGTAALAALRAAQGLAMAAILVCARAAVRDLFSAGEGLQVMARGLSGLGVVALISPLAGAWMVQTFGWRAVMVAMGVYGALLGVACWRWFGETLGARGASAAVPESSRAQVRQVLTNGPFRVWTGVSSFSYAGVFCFLLLSPMVYITLLGLSPALYGWIPAGGSLVYIASTQLCRRLLRHRGAVRTVQLGALSSVSGGLMQVAGWLLWPGAAWPLLAGHAVYVLGHGIHQPCGQAGAVQDLPALAGRAVSWSGFLMMLCAFCAGQTAALFVGPQMPYGPWPMVLPLLLAGVVLVVLAFTVLPRHAVAARPAA
ncbi:MFS transporter [Ottowia sp. SB7-C50]|uniref:MFS transporter n=1 Tax=Ottowia sp. SB7-C50 TaxID=3081231 RepID=UPI00295401B2|nr:MFS transporter [Ottowia sp. SB7-C50]WOP15532.1 MFS transporter [Ottowia sp. SB7-C50]